MAVLTVKKLQENIYKFNENGHDDVDAFLVIGDKKAVMIDGLMDAKGMFEEARKLTALPMEMLITHGHPDHAGMGTKEFIEAGCPVYIMTDDRKLLPEFGIDYPKEALLEINDGDIFDLGGMTLKVIALPGHTHGSFILYCPEKNVIFSSDALGSGDIWMWLDHSTTLTEFKKNLTPVLEFIRTIPDVMIYPGHTNQIPDYRGDGDAHIDLAYVEDLMAVTTDLIDGRKIGNRIENAPEMMKGVEVCTTTGNIMIGYTYDRQRIR